LPSAPIWHSAKFILKVKKTLSSARSRALGKVGEYTLPAPFFLLLSQLSLSRLSVAPAAASLRCRRRPALSPARRVRPRPSTPRPRRVRPRPPRPPSPAPTRPPAVPSPAPDRPPLRPRPLTFTRRRRRRARYALGRPRAPSTPSAAARPLRRRARAPRRAPATNAARHHRRRKPPPRAPPPPPGHAYHATTRHSAKV
jgi:hypothetical protein